MLLRLPAGVRGAVDGSSVEADIMAFSFFERLTWLLYGMAEVWQQNVLQDHITYGNEWLRKRRFHIRFHIQGN